MTIRFAPRTTGLLLASLLLAPELLQAQNGFMDRNTGAPPPEYASQGQTDVFLASFKIGNASGTTTSVTSITFTNAGTLPMTSVSNWRLFNSATRPIIGAATALGTVSTTATTVTFSSIAGASTGTNSNNGIKFWVYGDIATGATIGQTLKLSLNANTDVTYSPVLASNGSRATPVRAGIDTGIFDQSTTTILKSGSPATGFAHIVYERDNPPEIALIPGEARVRLGSFRCYADAGNATLSSVTFSNTAVSLLADTNITRVRLYTDDNAGPEDGATLIGAGSFSGDVITFSGLSTTFTTTPSWLHVQADISPSAPVGQSFKLDILAAGDVTFSAGTSGLDAATTPATTGAPVCRVATFKRVIAAGGGDYTTLGAAITAIPAVLTSPWVIEVQDGATYSENVTISGKTASAQNPIWLRAGLGYAPKIASNPTTANNTLLVSGVTDVKVSGFDISGSTGTTGTYGVVAAIASSHRVVFERLYVHNGASGIRVDTTNDWTIRNCVISKIFVGTNAYTSIVANSASRGRYYNNTWVHDGEGTTAVFLATEAHGFYNSLSSDVTVRNSLFRFRPYTKSGGGVTYVAFYLSGGAASDGFSSDFNYVYNVNNASAIAQHIYWGRIATYSSTSALWLQYTGDEKYSVTGFELISAFVDPANGDYHLKSTSGHWASAGFVTDGTDGEGSIARQTAASPTMDVSSSDPPHAGDYFLAPYNYYHRQQPSNGVIALRASTTTTASVSAGATTISVADTAKFSIGTGTGRGVIEGDDFSYTGTSVASGPGNLTGVAGVSVAHPTIGTQIVSDGRGPELGAFGNCEQASLAGGSYGGTKVWNGSIDTNWDTAGNWTPSGAPGSSDTVFIPSAGSAPTLSSALPQIRTLGISGHTLTISSSVAPPFITGAFEYQLFMPWRTSRVIMGSVTVVTGVLAMPSGAIDFGGDLRTYPTTPGALNLTGGSISFSGTVRQSIDLGAAESFNTLTFLAATPAAETWSSFAVKGNFSLARSLLQSNSAKVTLDGTGPQALNVNAAGVSFGGDLIVNQTPASTVTVGGSNPGITVGGTLTVTSGTLTLSGANSSFNVTLDGGTINQSSGTASFGGTVTASSGALQNTGATWTFGGGSTLTLSGGTVVATGGTTNLNGTVGASTGILRCSGGGMNVANALTVSGALLDVTGGTLTLSNGLTVSSGAFSASTGTVNFNSGFGLTIGSAGVWTAGSAGAPTFTRSDATTYSILCQGTASISALNLQNLNGTGLKFGTNTIAGDSDTVAATITALDGVALSNCVAGVLFRNITNATSSGSPLALRAWDIDGSIQASGYNARIDGGSSYWITFENATGASGQRNGAGSDGEVWDVDPFDSDFPALPGSAAPVSTGQIRWVYYRWKWLGEVNTSWGDTSGTPLAANWEKDGIRASSMPFFPDTSTDDVYIVLGVPPSFRNCNIDGVGVTRTVRSLTQASGTFSIPATNNLIVYGDFYKSSAGTFGPAPGVELRFPTSTDQRLTVVGGGSYNFGLRVWKTGGTLTLGSSLSTVGVFDMTGGAFDIGGNTLTVNNTLTVANGATLKMLSAGGVLKEDATYSGDYTIAGALSMGSNARVDLSASSGDLTLSGTGALSMTGTSMLTGGTGTTALNGTVTLTGSVTIRVPAAAWLTFSGAFTATAASGSPTLTTVSGRMNNLAFNTGASLNVNGLNVSAHPTGGMSIASGCTLTRFDDVAFTNAANGGSHLAITGGSYTLTASGCSFDSTFGGIGYNVDASSMAGGTITFSQPQGAGAGETYDNDPAEPGGNRILFARTLRWVGNWRYRIEIGSELTISETVGETICVQFDPKTTPTAAALLGGTEAVTGADDLRVVYYDDSAAPGYQYTELARQVVGDHTTFTSSIMLQIYFAMPVSFAVGDRVWLYYGNAAPSPAPTASLLTQRFKDDFEDGTLNAWNAGSTKATNSTLANWQRTRGLALDDSAGGDGLIVKSTTGVPEIVEAAIQGTAKATSMRFELTDTNESGGIALTATNVMYLNGSGIYVDFSPVVPYAAATWYHVRLVFHAPNQYDIYVDGNLVRSNSATFAGAFTPQITFGNTGGATPDLYADNVTAWSGSIAAVLNVFGTEGGVVGTTTSEWEDPFNWTDGATPAGLGPPTSSDDAVIDGGYTYAPLLADLTNHFCLGLDIGRTSISLLNFNGGGSIVAGGNVTIGPFGTVDATGDNGDLSVGGDYANNGTFTPGSTTLAMDGSHFQALNGGSAAQRTVFHFRVNNTGVAGNNTATALGGFDINGNLLILAGKFDPGSFTHTVGGDWDDSGGSFTPTAGTIELDGGVARTLMTIAANNFWNLTLASSTPISFAPGSDLTLDVDGDLVVASMSALDMWDGTNPAVLDVEGNLSLGAGGSLNPRTSTAHDVGGDWFDFDGTFTPTAGTITLSSSGSSTISVGSTNNFFNLTVSNPGTTSFAAGSDLTLDVNGLLVVDAGTLDMTDGTSDVAFDVAVDLYISSGGTLNPRGSTAHNVAGNWDDSGGAFTPTAGTVTLSDADGSTIKSAAANNFFNLTVSNAGTTLFDPATDPVLDVNGSLAVSGGTLDMKAGGTDVSLDVEGNLTLSGAGILDPRGSTTHDVAGNWDDSGGTFTPIAGRITLSDADGSTIDVASGNNFFDLTVSNAGTTSFATGSDLVLDVNGDLLVSGGTLDMQDGAAAAVALDVEGNLTLSGGVTTILDPRASTAHDVAGNWDDSGGTFQQAAGKITLSDTDGSTIKVAAANYFNGLTIDNTGTTSMDAATPDGIDVRGNFTVQGGTFEFGDDSHAIGDAAADLFLISSLGIVEMGTSTVTCLADIDVIGTGVPELRFTAGAATLKMGPSQLLRVGNGFAAWAGKLVCSGAGTVSTITTSGFVGVNLWGLTVTNFSTLSVNKAGTAGDRLRILSHSPGGVQIDSGAILNNGTAGEAKGIAFDNMVNSGTDDTYLVFNSTGAENFILRNCSFDAAACDHNVSVAVAFFGTVRMYGTTGTKGTEAFEDDPVGTGVTTPGRILWPVTLSGVVRQVDETSPLTGIAMDVSALVNGGASPDDTQPVNTGTGAFSVQAITLTGDVLTLFIDNHARKGVIVTTSNSVPISGLNLIEDRLVVRNDSFSVTTNVDLDTGHNGDADLTALYADGGAPGQTLDVAAGKILYLEGGTYRPGIGSGTVNTPALRVAGGALSLATADYTVNVTNASYFFELSSGSVTIDSAGDLLNADGDISILGGGLTMSAGLITCAGNWDDTAASGAFNPTGGTVRMDSVGVSKDISQRTAATANSFYDLDIAATASTIGAFTPIAVTNNLTKYMGGDYDTRGNTHTIAGRLIVNAGTFIMNSLGDVTVNVNGTGDAGATAALTLGGGTLRMDSAGDTLNVAGGVTITSGAEDVTAGLITVAKNWDDSAGFGSWSPAGGRVVFGGAPAADWATSFVISEVQVQGSNGADDEFVELYNPSASVVSLTGIKISIYDSAGAYVGDFISSLNMSNIPGYSYVLLAPAAYDGVTGESWTTPGTFTLEPDRSIRLYINGTTLLDGVGWGAATAGGVEGSAESWIPSPGVDESIERKPGGASPGNGIDSNDNSADFDVRSPSDPQNIGSTEQPNGGARSVIQRSVATANSFFDLSLSGSPALSLTPGTNANASGNLQVTGTFTVDNGKFDARGFTHTIGNRLVLNGGTFILGEAGNATVNVNGTGDVGGSAALTVTGGELRFNSVTDTLTLSAGGFWMTGGRGVMTSGLLSVAKGWDDSAAPNGWQPGAGIVRFTGTGTIKQRSLATRNNFFTMEVTGGARSIAATDANADGSLDIDGNVTISGGPAGFDPGSYTHTVAGNWDDSGASGGFVPAAGTINFNGTGTIKQRTVFAPNRFFNLTISAGTRSIAATDGNSNGSLDINGSFTLSGTGTFAPDVYTHTVAGNWTSTAGTFAPAGGIIRFDGAGAQSINSTTPRAFRQLQIANTSVVDAVTCFGTVEMSGASSVEDGTFEVGSATVRALAGFTAAGMGSPVLSMTGTGTLRIGSGQVLTIGDTANPAQLACSGVGTATTITTAGGAGTYWTFLVKSLATLNVNKAGSGTDKLIVDALDTIGLRLENGSLVNNGTANVIRGIEFSGQQPGGTSLEFQSTGAQTYWVKDCIFGLPATGADRNVKRDAAFGGTIRMVNPSGDRGTEGFEADPVVQVAGPAILWSSSAVSGTVRGTDEATAVTGDPMSVSLLIGGALLDTQPVNVADGTFTVSSVFNTGDILTLFIDGHASNRAVTVTRTTGGALAGLNVILDRLVVRNDNGGTTNNAALDAANNADPDITSIYTDGGGATLTVAAGKRLYLEAGNYEPDFLMSVVTTTPELKIAGGTLSCALWDHTVNVTSPGANAFSMTSGSLVIDSVAAVLDVNGSITLSGGVTTMSKGLIICGGNWNDTAGSGAFVPTGGTVRFDGGGTHNVSQRSAATANAFYNVEVDNGAVDVVALTNLTVTNNFTTLIGASSSFDTGAFTHTIGNRLIINGGTFRFTATGDATVNVNGTGEAGAGTAAMEITVGTLEMNSAGDTLNIAGGVTISGGVEAVSAGTISVGKNWNDSTGDGAFTPTGGTVRMAKTLPNWANNIVISEVQIRGTNGEADEFIELHNPTAASIALSNARVELYDSSGTFVGNLTNAFSTTILAHKHFLIAPAEYNGAAAANTGYGGALRMAPDNSIRLTNNIGAELLDGVGWGTASGGGVEGSVFPTNPGDLASDQSIERKPGASGTGNGTDSGSNAADFDLRGASDPQNVSSAPEQPTGQTITQRTAATANAFYDLEIASGSGIVVSAMSNLTVNNNLTVTTGAFDTGAATTHTIGQRLILNGGVTRFTIAGSWSVVNVNGAGDSGATAALTIAGGTLEMNTNAPGADVLNINNGGVTITGGTENVTGGEIYVLKGWDDSAGNGAWTPGSGILFFTGTGAIKQRSLATRNNFSELRITGGARTIAAPDANADGTLNVNWHFTISGGTFDPGPYTHTFRGNWDDSAADGAFAPAAGTIKFSGTGTIKQRSAGTRNRFFNFEHNNGIRSIAATDANSDGSLDIDGSVSITGAGSFSPGAYTHTVAGDWTMTEASPGFTPASGTIRFDGAGAQTISSIAGKNFWAVQIMNTSAVDAVTLSGAVTVNDAINGVLVDNGTLEVGGATLVALGGINVSGMGNPGLSMTGAGTIQLGIGESILVGDAVNPALFACSGAGTVSQITTTGTVGTDTWGFEVRNAASLSVNKAGSVTDELRLISISTAGLRLLAGSLVNNGTAGEIKGIHFSKQPSGGTNLDFGDTGATNYEVKNCVFEGPGNPEVAPTGGTDFNVRRAAGYTGIIKMSAITGLRGTLAYEADSVGVTTPGQIRWGFALTGIVRQADEVTALTGTAMNVSVLINGGAPVDTQAVNIADGSFTLNTNGSAGDITTVYIENHGIHDAVIVTEASGADLAGLNLIKSRLVVRNDNGGVTTNPELDAANNGDADITTIYADAGGASLNLPYARLYLEAGSYQPDTASGGTTTATWMRIAGGTLSFGGGDHTVNVTGTGTSFEMTSGSFGLDSAGDLLNVDGFFWITGGSTTTSAGLITCAGDWDDSAASGGFVPTGGRVRFDGGPPAGWATQVVISEVQVRGTQPGFEEDDEFVELYNPTSSAIDLTGWSIDVYDSSGAPRGTLTSLPSVSIPAFGHVLLGSDMYDGGVAADATYGGILYLELDNSIILRDSTPAYVDGVGWGAGTFGGGVEATAFGANPAGADSSIERLPSGAVGNGLDTGDNNADFLSQVVSGPQNASSPTSPPTGATQSITQRTSAGPNRFFDLEVAPNIVTTVLPSSNADASGDLTVASDFTMTSGTFLAAPLGATHTITFRLILNGGTFRFPVSGASTVNVNGTNDSGAFAALTVNGGTLEMDSLGDLLAVAGGVTITGGAEAITGGRIDVGKGWDDSGASGVWTPSGGVVRFNGATAGTYAILQRTAVTRNSFFHLTIQGGAGVIYQIQENANAVYPTGAPFLVTGALTVASGTFDLENLAADDPFVTVVGNVLVSDGATMTAAGNASAFRVGGNWTTDGTFTIGAMTVGFNGVATQVISSNDALNSFDKIAVGIDDTATVVSLANDITLATSCPNMVQEGTLTLNGRILDSSSGGTLNVNSGGTLQMTAGSRIELKPATTLVIDSGGTLSTTGTSAASRAVITHNQAGGGIGLTINGTVDMRFYRIEWPDTSGFNLKAGATIVSLDDGEFDYPASGGSLMQVSSGTNVNIYGCRFYNTAGRSNASNVKSTAGGDRAVTMYGWGGELGGADYEIDAFNRITWTQNVFTRISGAGGETNYGTLQDALNAAVANDIIEARGGAVNDLGGTTVTFPNVSGVVVRNAFLANGSIQSNPAAASGNRGILRNCFVAFALGTQNIGNSAQLDFVQNCTVVDETNTAGSKINAEWIENCLLSGTGGTFSSANPVLTSMAGAPTTGFVDAARRDFHLDPRATSTTTAALVGGEASIPVANTALFAAGGGTAFIEGDDFTYTGKSVASGAGNLTGVASLTSAHASGALVTESRAIDLGTDLNAVHGGHGAHGFADDIDGTPRAQGTAWDVGADEFGASLISSSTPASAPTWSTSEVAGTNFGRFLAPADYDFWTGMLYAGTGTGGGANNQALLAINPTTGTADRVMFLKSVLDLQDDGLANSSIPNAVPMTIPVMFRTLAAETPASADIILLAVDTDIPLDGVGDRLVAARDLRSTTTEVADATDNGGDITVSSTIDFPASGTAYIEGDSFAYTGTTGTSFTGVSGIDVAHASGLTAGMFVLVSTFSPGGTTGGGVLDSTDAVGDRLFEPVGQPAWAQISGATWVFIPSAIASGGAPRVSRITMAGSRSAGGGWSNATRYPDYRAPLFYGSGLNYIYAPLTDDTGGQDVCSWAAAASAAVNATPLGTVTVNRRPPIFVSPSSAASWVMSAPDANNAYAVAGATGAAQWTSPDLGGKPTTQCFNPSSYTWAYLGVGQRIAKFNRATGVLADDADAAGEDWPTTDWLRGPITTNLLSFGGWMYFGTERGYCYRISNLNGVGATDDGANGIVGGFPYRVPGSPRVMGVSFSFAPKRAFYTCEDGRIIAFTIP